MCAQVAINPTGSDEFQEASRKILVNAIPATHNFQGSHIAAKIIAAWSGEIWNVDELKETDKNHIHDRHPIQEASIITILQSLFALKSSH